jgi:hypothetical protein
VWITAAPIGSALRKKLDESTQNRFELYEGDGGSGHPLRMRFDVGGKYTLVVQEYISGASAYGGGHQGSPDGAPSETKVGSETTLALHIGQRLTSQLSVGPDALTVVLWVFDDTIRRTTKGVQGEDSPTIQATSGTARALAVVESSAIVSAAAGLADQAVSTAIGLAPTVFADLVDRWNAHLITSGIHNADDTDNGIALGLSNSSSATGLAAAITEVLPLIRQHYTNDATKGGALFGRDSAAYHQVSSLKVNDNVDLPIVAGASQLSDAYWATAELCRSYESHRASADFHLLPDSANVLAARPPLMQLGELILGILASFSPSTPATQSTGAMKLIARAGFAETPL